MDVVVFYLAAATTLIGAVMVLVNPNPLRGAMALIMSLGGMSLVYLLLHAQFVAVMQLLVYAGAIMVLFVFVIMLLNLQQVGAARRGLGVTLLVTAIVGGVAFVLSRALGLQQLTYTKVGQAPGTMGSNFGTVEQVGELLLRDLVLPFEMLSLLLLVAVLGAVIIAKKRL